MSSSINNQNTNFRRTDPSINRSQEDFQEATTQTKKNPSIVLSGQQNQGDSSPAIVKHFNSQEILINISDEYRVIDFSNNRNETPSATISSSILASISYISIRRSAEPTITFSRPFHTRKSVTYIEFLENFGSSKSKNRIYITYQKMEFRTYKKAINSPDARE